VDVNEELPQPAEHVTPEFEYAAEFFATTTENDVLQCVINLRTVREFSGYPYQITTTQRWDAATNTLYVVLTGLTLNNTSAVASLFAHTTIEQVVPRSTQVTIVITRKHAQATYNLITTHDCITEGEPYLAKQTFIVAHVAGNKR
jgi:hypothetical protein